ncbi:hypothetical protein [Arthrobacter sp. 3Tela_A]|uniref:hypothetical protein n=1 Tax=Arthrobacter sp. 3Tela_A TaxID=3093743 RepID=UPI003BB54FEA
MPFYKLPAAGLAQQQAPPAAGRPVPNQDPSRPAGPDRRPALSRVQYVLGLLRLLRRAAAVRVTASGRLVDEQEERQLRLLRISSPSSASGR